MAIIAVDVGSTIIRAAVFDPATQELSAEVRVPTRDAELYVPSIVEAVEACAKKAGAERAGLTDADSAAYISVDPVSIEAVGLSTPGIVLVDEGVIEYSKHLRIYEYPVRRMVEAALGVPVFMDNDVRTGAFGESKAGYGQTRQSFLYVSIGSGLAFALVIDNKVVSLSNWGGELGQVSYPAPHIGPTALAALEKIAASRGIMERVLRASEPTREIPGRVVMATKDLNYEVLYEAFRYWAERAYFSTEELLLSFDNGAREVRIRDIDGIIRDQINALAHVVGNLAGLFGPVPIVFGGGVALAGEDFFSRVATEARNFYLRVLPAPDLIPSPLGANGKLLGAGLLAFQGFG
ncbi:MAG: ROK family protein [Corynebacterium sp.]|nr:ROK family protein [Corynebacterium sp.]